jgi:hypothetical protein
MYDYLYWRGDLSTAQSAFNEVDAMILARFSYLPFEYALRQPDDSMSIEQAASILLAAPDLQEKVVLQEDIQLLQHISDSNRFRGMILSDYENRIDPQLQTQFAAVTIRLQPDLYYIAYRGTDATIVGWKEDFNMSFLSPIPAQKMAVEYLERVLSKIDGRLILGGHSKGGNLAVYAAAFCGTAAQRRIERVFSFDGPGFDKKVILSDGYNRISDRITTFVPQSSIIGMLLEHEEKYTIVHSRQIGALQHNVYSWEIDRTHFVYLQTVTNSSRLIDSTLKEWVAASDPQQREIFIDTIYQILTETNIRTVKDLEENWFVHAKTLLKSMRSLDDATHQAVTSTLRSLMRCAREELRQSLQSNP